MPRAPVIQHLAGLLPSDRPLLRQRPFRGRAIRLNSDMGPAEVRQFCELDTPGEQLMRAAVRQLQRSARADHRVLKLARIIADLAAESTIQAHHLAETLRYRPRGAG